MKFAKRTFALQSRVKNGKFTPRKTSREFLVQKYSCKVPVFQNCRIYTNDGCLFSYCDRKKLEWYLNRGLAKLVDDDPPAITLLFEPKGRPKDEGNDIYIQSKRNLCVGCAEKYKRHIAAEFGIPLYVRNMVDSRELRIAAAALLRHGPRLPPNRRDELIVIVKTYYGGKDVTSQDLENALMVGMSPRQRRKIEKKNGAPQKQSPLTKENTPAFINVHPEEKTRPDESLDIEDEASHDQLVNKSELDEVIPLAATSGKISDINDVNTSDAEHIIDSDVGVANTDPPNTNSKRGRTKVLSLAHRPHGKEVVEYVLKKYGDEGVQQFCQRWKRVFVDAVNPRYLPAGWDVKHRGKRDSGDFSVYNPTKKLCGETE